MSLALALCLALAAALPALAGQYNTIAHKLLEMESELGLPSDSRVLDQIITEAQLRIQLRDSYTRDQALEILSTIHELILEKRFLYKASSFTLSETLTPRRLSGNELDLLASYDTLSQDFRQSGLQYFNYYCEGCVLYLDRRRQEPEIAANPNAEYHLTQCATLTFIYLGVADALNLPCRALNLPLHLALRWDLPDGTYINWQPLSGREESDQELTASYSLQPSHISSGVYLRPLNDQEVLAVDWFLIGVAWEDRNDPERAVAAFQRSLYLDDHSPLPYFHLAVLSYIDQRYDAALSNVDQAIRLDPFFARSYSIRGRAHLRLENLNAAIGDFTKAMELEPLLAEAYLGRAWCLYMQDRLQEALPDFNRAIELEPESASAYMGRGSTLRLLGQTEAAEADLARAESLEGSSGEVSSTRNGEQEEPEAGLLQQVSALDLRKAVNQLSVDGRPVIVAFVTGADSDSIRTLSVLAEQVKNGAGDHISFIVIFCDNANTPDKIGLLQSIADLTPLIGFAYYGGPQVAQEFQVGTIPTLLLYTRTGDLAARLEGAVDKYTLSDKLPGLLGG